MEVSNASKTIVVFLLLIMFISLFATSFTTPDTEGFERNNVYDADGYRDAGYFVERHNSSIDGYMNVTYLENTNIFYINCSNIKNITLDFDDLYQNRAFLFGWVNTSWVDAVRYLKKIVIYVNTDDGIEYFHLIDYPEARITATVDNITVKQEFVNGTLTNETGIGAGAHTLTITFNKLPETTFNILMELFRFVITVAILVTILYLIQNNVLDSIKKGGK